MKAVDRALRDMPAGKTCLGDIEAPRTEHRLRQHPVTITWRARPRGVIWAASVLPAPALVAIFGQNNGAARPGGVTWAASSLSLPALVAFRWAMSRGEPALVALLGRCVLLAPALVANFGLPCHPVIQRPPWWQLLGSCLTPAPGLKAHRGRGTRDGTPQKKTFSLKTVT